MSAAIDVLMAEHRTIERVLDTLELFADRYEREAPATVPPELGHFVAFFRTYLDELHHGKEERILFEAMTAHGFPTDGGPIAVMLHEHELGRGLVGRLAKLAGASQHRPEERAELGRTAREFSALLREHILKEDSILYPMAQARLPPAAMAAVDAACADADARQDQERGRLAALADQLVAAAAGR